MAYIRCEECGAKALVAASTCPMCAHPFETHDSRGERAVLKRCSGCGIMHRRDRTCHWCGDVSHTAWRSPRVVQTGVGIAAVALAAVGVWRYGADAQRSVSRAFAAMTAVEAPLTRVASTTRQSTRPAVPYELMVGADSATIMSRLATTSTTADSVRWIPAVARTWVNVRNDASRGGNVVGVINPASKAMLGETRAGWRQVRSTDSVIGWADPKLFEADSLRTRG